MLVFIFFRHEVHPRLQTPSLSRIRSGTRTEWENMCARHTSWWDCPISPSRCHAILCLRRIGAWDCVFEIRQLLVVDILLRLRVCVSLKVCLVWKEPPLTHVARVWKEALHFYWFRDAAKFFNSLLSGNIWLLKKIGMQILLSMLLTKPF